MNYPVLRRRLRRQLPQRRFKMGQLVCTVPSLDVDGTLICDHGWIVRAQWNHPILVEPGWAYAIRFHPATQSGSVGGKVEWLPEFSLQQLADFSSVEALGGAPCW